MSAALCCALASITRTADPGLHFAVWPIETMEKPRVGAVRQINIGMEGNEGQMLTSDKNIISVPFSVFWRISGAQGLPVQRGRPGAHNHGRLPKAPCVKSLARRGRK